MNFEYPTSNQEQRMNFEPGTKNQERRMKKALRYSKFLVLYSVVHLLGVSQGMAAEKAPTGIAAQLTVATGKTIPVRLQALENGKVTFKAGSKEMTVPANKISRFEFSLNKEEFDFFTGNKIISDEAVKEIFNTPDLGKREKLGMIFKQVLENVAADYNAGNYAEVVSAIAPYLTERTPYMQVENNLQETFLILMDSYRELGNFSQVKACTVPLLKSNDEHLILKAQVNNAMAAISEADFQTAEEIRGQIENEAAALYLEAWIKRAQGNPKEAIQVVTTVIAEHANEVEWTAPSELLSAYLYMDMISTNDVGITTNSAINTARQVKNIYGGTAVAADAHKLWASIGGEAIEAADKAHKVEMKRLKKEREDKIKAQQEARKAEEAATRAAEEAAAAASATTNPVDATTTEIESE